MSQLVYPNWRAGLKVTGRWSSFGPNLQNIPKAAFNAAGEKVRDSLRDLYQARPGKWLVEADWSQLELRLATMHSQDPPLLEAYANSLDVHRENAKGLFRTDDPRDDQRKLAKIFVFGGALYRGAPKTIHRQLAPGFPAVTIKTVEELIRRWDEAHPALAEWQKEQVRRCTKQGYVEEVLSGRRYYFHMGQVEATICLNFPIQGAAATLCNQAILEVADELDWEKEAIVMQVHDAIICEGPDPDRLAEILRRCMTKHIQGVDFPVDVAKGRHWGEMKEMS